MDAGTRVFWVLIAVLLGASLFFTVSVVADEARAPKPTSASRE